MLWLGVGARAHARSLPETTLIDRKPAVSGRATPTACATCAVPNASMLVRSRLPSAEDAPESPEVYN